MNFAFTPEQQELRAAARDFLRDHSSGEQVRRAMESELGFDPDVWKRISTELGWPAIVIPEECGGLGLGAVELVALMEVMGEALLCAPFFSSVCLGAESVLRAGSDAQRTELLPPLAAGERRATLALTEPAGAWDAGGVETVARRDGEGYVLSGHKRFIPDGHSADLLVVVARAEGSQGADGVSLFAVPAATAGVQRTLLPTLDQTRRQADVRLEDVRVPRSSLLGDEGRGWPAVEQTLHRAAIALAAEQVGGAQRCLDLTVAHALEREQFGRPIGSFQAVKHKCADMMLRVESARSAAYAAACHIDEGDDIAAVASLAKAYCSDAYFQCAADAIQIHGGVGFTWEYDVHLYFKRAKSSETLLGDPSLHRERVARQIGL